MKKQKEATRGRFARLDISGGVAVFTPGEEPTPTEQIQAMAAMAGEAGAALESEKL